VIERKARSRSGKWQQVLPQKMADERFGSAPASRSPAGRNAATLQRSAAMSKTLSARFMRSRSTQTRSGRRRQEIAWGGVAMDQHLPILHMRACSRHRSRSQYNIRRIPGSDDSLVAQSSPPAGQVGASPAKKSTPRPLAVRLCRLPKVGQRVSFAKSAACAFP